MRSPPVCIQFMRPGSRLDVGNISLFWVFARSTAAQQWHRLYATNARRKAPPKVPAGKIETACRPVRNEEEYKIWTASSDRGMSRLERSTEDFQVGTQRLTALCQKQVNFWHDLSALTDDEIAGVKKIGKISILYRNKNSIQFIDYLDKEKCFNPEILYLAAQTLFRPLPASASPRESFLPQEIDQGIFNACIGLRFRCFYAGLLAGHVPSALWLWSVVPYDTPEGNAEKEMILRCLGDKNLQTVKKDIAILANAVKADEAGDVAGARKLYGQLGRLSLGEFEFLWKRQVEYLYAADEEAALGTIISGVPWVASPLIAATLEEFLRTSTNKKTQVRLAIQLHDYNARKYSINDIAKRYEALGDELMAAGWHELAGAQGNKDSQAWLVKYLEGMAKVSWFRGRSYRKRLDRWKQFIGNASQSRLGSEPPKGSGELL